MWSLYFGIFFLYVDNEGSPDRDRLDLGLDMRIQRKFNSMICVFDVFGQKYSRLGNPREGLYRK